jgi:hypothetical protein
MEAEENCTMKSLIICTLLPNIIKMIKSYRMKWEVHAACMEEIRNTYKILFGNPEENTPLGKSRLRQEGNIKTDLKELWWDGVALIHLAQDKDQ